MFSFLIKHTYVFESKIEEDIFEEIPFINAIVYFSNIEKAARKFGLKILKTYIDNDTLRFVFTVKGTKRKVLKFIKFLNNVLGTNFK